jgi:hypothetical protein
MIDLNTLLAAVAVSVAVLTSATLVLSRIIPDEYDRRVPVRSRIDPRLRRR